MAENGGSASKRNSKPRVVLAQGPAQHVDQAMLLPLTLVQVVHVVLVSRLHHIIT